MMHLLTFVKIGAQRCENAQTKKNCKTKEYHSIESNPRGVHVAVWSICSLDGRTAISSRSTYPIGLGVLTDIMKY